MPVSKKPRAKGASKTPPRAAAGPATPDRRAMESYLAAITGRNRNDAHPRPPRLPRRRRGQRAGSNPGEGRLVGK